MTLIWLQSVFDLLDADNYTIFSQDRLAILSRNQIPTRTSAKDSMGIGNAIYEDGQLPRPASTIKTKLAVAWYLDIVALMPLHDAR